MSRRRSFVCLAASRTVQPRAADFVGVDFDGSHFCQRVLNAALADQGSKVTRTAFTSSSSGGAAARSTKTCTGLRHLSQVRADIDMYLSFFNAANGVVTPHSIGTAPCI